LIFTFLLTAIKAQSQDFDKVISAKLDTQIEKYVEGINKKTRFNVASNAKQFTAFSVARLCRVTNMIKVSCRFNELFLD
jgi:hypothetical protein